MATPPVAGVRGLVAAASMAPSMHNAQPWLFEFAAADGLLDLRADPARTMPVTDPRGRGTRLSCGAALFTLRVAAAYYGWRADHVLLPEPDDPGLLARVCLTRAPGRASPDGRLFPAIARRRTSREPFSERPVPDDLRQALVDAAGTEGARLLFPDPWHVESVLDLVDEAEQKQHADPRARAELARWTRLTEKSLAAQDGVPSYALGPSRRYGRAPVRDFADGAAVPGRGRAEFERFPQIALLGTSGDSARDWLVAGQALGRVLLEATSRGLATSLTSQALEWRELRRFARDPRSTMGAVHMVLRLGYGPSGPPTPRRPVETILTVRAR
ncbi:Acg family FMN-binding oxidoreductase [Streptomyces sp. 8L]|uniref:Acg family FMN-binding oxidoreductase n=1 Tax=Streptomyces sp. 8L TaxID=2877242 RepID=UPI001CD547F5|nr:nitroreductase family protein [Streptomyces sp. 8L]MCA1221228.1 nitroreductase family protein [Streptomyces sp. 8L]